MKNLDKNEYPFTSYYFEINQQRMHYVDEGEGEVFLFVHGTPSWSFDFRKLIIDLSSTNRCIAIDHIGFGLSDKPKQYDYSTKNHANTLEKFILSKNLSNINLVVHDFGGPIGLSVAIKYPERFKRIILFNSWLWSAARDPEFIKLSKILRSPLLPFLYRYFNFSAQFILPRSFGEKKLSKKIKKQYTLVFKNKTEREGTLAFAYSLLNDQNWFEELWEKRESINQKACLFIWGMKDPVIKQTYLEKFKNGFPQAKVKQLLSCGHFPQEEEPEEVIKAIRKFLEG